MILPLFLFIRPKFEMMFVPFYQAQSKMFIALIIFRLKIPSLKEERECINKPLKEERECINKPLK